jgi:small subunit ribosomal protein S16
MPTKIRLQRKGKKGQPFYHLVIADGRAPREGKFIERIGTYNPLTKPADIKMDFDRALYWLQAGAQPTDTVRAILSYSGVLYKNHLIKGIKKGALTQEQADVKFADWLKEKREKIENKAKQVETDKKGDSKKRFEAEKMVNEARAEELAKKRAAELKAKEKQAEAENAEEVPAETPAETPVANEPATDAPATE